MSGPEERVDRRVARHRRQAHAAAAHHRRRGQPDGVGALRVTARGPVNGSGGGDGARLVAGFPGHTFRGHGKARRKVGVLRPTKTVGWGHSAPVKGILRNAAGQPVAGADCACSCASCASARATSTAARSPPAPTVASRSAFRAVLTPLPRRLSLLPGRRRPRRQVRHLLQHQGADHHPRPAPCPRARERALPRQPPRPPAPPARGDPRAPGPPAGPRLAHGQDHPHAQGRRVLDALPLQFRRRPIHVPNPPATERQLSVRARDERGPTGERWLDAHWSPRFSVPAHWRQPRHRRAATTSTPARSGPPSTPTTRGWVSTPLLAGDPAFTAPDTTCANASDPLVALMRPAAAGATVAYAATVSSALHLSVTGRHAHHQLRARPCGIGSARRATSASISCSLGPRGGVPSRGLEIRTPREIRPAINAEKHWYGAGAAVDSGFVTLTKADSPQAQAPRLGDVDHALRGLLPAPARARSTRTASTSCSSWVTCHDRGHAAAGPDSRPGGARPARVGIRSGDEPVTFSADRQLGHRASGDRRRDECRQPDRRRQ